MDREQAVRIARAVHAANCGWNAGLGDPAPDPAVFEILEGWQQEFLIERVHAIDSERHILEDEELAWYIHDMWVNLMISRGWELGDKKDPAAAPPTHPCLQDLRKLPPDQQKKDFMAIAIVKALL